VTDESTASIDSANTEIIERIILEKKKSGMTMVITTHDRTQAERLGDRMLFLKNGRIVSGADETGSA